MKIVAYHTTLSLDEETEQIIKEKRKNDKKFNLSKFLKDKLKEEALKEIELAKRFRAAEIEKER